MSKGQRRSNREAKKPKQTKPKVAPSVLSSASAPMQAKADLAGRGNKKR